MIMGDVYALAATGGVRQRRQKRHQAAKIGGTYQDELERLLAMSSGNVWYILNSIGASYGKTAWRSARRKVAAGAVAALCSSGRRWRRRCADQ